MRLGSLPYPGPFTLFASADPDDLGPHRYASMLPLLNEEESRGILYTCRAGFLDMSHVRDTIDLSRYFYVACAEAVREGEDHLVVQAFSPCRFHVTLNVPMQWSDAISEDGVFPAELEDALIETGLRLAYIATTWYEFLQGYGYRSAVIVPETRSAFTYDDVMAHVVGVDIARRALHKSTCEDSFNKAVAEILEETLNDLGVVPPEKMRRAVELVHGHWWEGGQAIRRHLELGHETGTITPWLVRGLETCGDREPEPFDVPRLNDSLRPDGGPFAEIEIEMRIFEAGAIRRVLPGEPERIVPHRDFPLLLAHLRDELAERFGENVDRPWP